MFAYWYGDPQLHLKKWLNKASLKDDKPVCNNLTSSNKLWSTITAVSYIPVKVNVHYI